MIGGRALAHPVLMRALGVALLAVLGRSVEAGQAQTAAAPAAHEASTKAVLDKYCVTCHSDRMKTGGLSLQKADVADVAGGAEVWEKVIRKLRTGGMPAADW